MIAVAHSEQVPASTSAVREAPAHLEEAYRGYSGLCFKALSTLANRGYRLDPADALDVVHDFFVEAWPGVHRRFDPSKAEYSTYLYAAFYRFAQRKLLRLRRHQSSLEDLANIRLSLLPAESPESRFAEGMDARFLAVAWNKLEPAEQQVLAAYFNSEKPSERQIAKTLGLSRYAFRLGLVEALGRLVVQLDRPSSIPENDWRIAVAVWKHGYTRDQVAAALQLDCSDVEAAQARTHSWLAASLPTSRTKRTPS